MGFSVETVVIQGRPSPEELSSWARLALSRLPQPQVHVPGEDRPRFDLRATQTLEAAGRAQSRRPEEFTLVWIANATSATSATVQPDRGIFSFGPILRLFGIGRRDRAQWPRMTEPGNLPALPKEAAGNPFLITLALFAKSSGRAAAFFADSSISDAGSVFAPGVGAASWSEKSAEEGRSKADALLRRTFGAEGPSTDELQWSGGRKPFWSRRLISSGERVNE